MTTVDLNTYTLSTGSHSTPAQGVCLLELTALFAGKPMTDQPPCVSPVLRRYGIALNDRLPDQPRQELKRYIPAMIGTAGDGLDSKRADLVRRALMTDWLPAWLRLANLNDLAVQCEQAQNLTGADLRAALRGIRDVTWRARQEQRTLLTERIKAEMVKRDRPAAAATVAAAAAAAVAAAAAAAATVAAAAAAADAVAVAVAVAVAAADAAAATVAVAAADAAAATVAVAVADAAAAADAVADAAADAVAVAAAAAATATATATAAAADAATAAAAAAAAATATAADAATAAAAAAPWGTTYTAVYKAMLKHHEESHTFRAVRKLRDSQLVASAALFGQMVEVTA